VKPEQQAGMSSKAGSRMSQPDDHINHPTYYGGDTQYEVIKVIEAWQLGFHGGNAVKYIARAGKKDSAPELDDLKKARWYLDRLIQEKERDAAGTDSPGPTPKGFPDNRHVHATGASV
jgi:hypothetical protein